MQVRMTGKRGNIWRCAVALLLLSVSMAGYGSGGPFIIRGYVEARGLVLGPNQQPIFVEYDTQGKYDNSAINEERTGKYANATVMSVTEYNNYVDQMAAIKQANKGSYVMKAQDYNAKLGSGGFTIQVPGSDGYYKKQKVSGTPVPDAIKSVLIRSLTNIHNAVALPNGPALFEAPVDLTTGHGAVGTTYKSLIISNTGEILDMSALDIGYKVAYFEPKSGGSADPNNWLSSPGDTLVHPVAGAMLESALALGLSGSDDNGKFNIYFLIPPCPGFSFSYALTTFAGIHTHTFNPQNPNSVGYQYFRSAPAYTECVGYGEGPLAASGSLTGLMAAVDASAISAESNLSNSPRILIPTDILEFDGKVILNNVNLADGGAPEPDGVTLPVGSATRYNPPSAAAQPVATSNQNAFGFDANSSGGADWMSLSASDSNVVNVCLTPPADGQSCINGTAATAITPATPGNDDFQRVRDYKADFNNEGLLKAIGTADLENTDFYVFRVSTGRLLVSQKGIKQRRIINGVAYFQILMPGPQSGNAIAASTGVDGWQEKLGLNAAVRGRNIDAIRPGERVEVVAFNRATGYLGTLRTPVQVPDPSMMAVNIKDLVLGPPNLKIEVKRTYQTAKGQQEHIVGYQGAGTTKDTAIEVRTIWMDRDGSPLPDCTAIEKCDMQMTGRLAVVNGGNTLTTVSGANSSGNQISLFPIRPGAYTQLITLNGDDLQPNHFYVQVSGEALTSDGFFNDLGSGADFGQRPKLYTPVRVPVFDEARYDQLRNAAVAAGQSVDDVPPAYQWPYRPEMGFSVVDLMDQLLTIHYKSSTGKPDKVIDLTRDDPSQAELSKLLNSDVEYAKLTYNLDTSTHDISAFGSAPQQYIFALGGDEHMATLNNDGTVTFNHTDSLQKVTGSDLESLSLYMNSDPSNVLWQVEMPGLYVYYQAPTPLQMVETDTTL